MLNRQIWLRQAKSVGTNPLTGVSPRKWIDTRTKNKKPKDNIWDDKTVWED